MKPEMNKISEISRFSGVAIRMFFRGNAAAHFHAIFDDKKVVVGVSPVRIITGDIPASVLHKVIEWARRHQQELMLCWYRCKASQIPFKIEPLR